VGRPARPLSDELPDDDAMLTPIGYPPHTQQPTWPTAHTVHSQHCGHTCVCARLPAIYKPVVKWRVCREGYATRRGGSCGEWGVTSGVRENEGSAEKGERKPNVQQQL